MVGVILNQMMPGDPVISGDPVMPGDLAHKPSTLDHDSSLMFWPQSN